MSAALLYAPLAFILGVAIGLGAASRWRVVQRAAYERWLHRRHDDG